MYIFYYVHLKKSGIFNSLSKFPHVSGCLPLIIFTGSGKKECFYRR